MEPVDIFKRHRNSRMQLGEVYFWINTVKDWISIFNHDRYKEILIHSLDDLVKRRKLVVYSFVIMPNHMHFVWKMLAMNGKEMPHASFNKYTAHCLIKDIQKNDTKLLQQLMVQEDERNHRIWQRDALAIFMDSREKIEQKLNYIHSNPLQERWNLVDSPENYLWSSAKFYETGEDTFGFLTHYRDDF